MRIVAVQRSARAGEVLRAPGGEASLPWSSVVQTLDRHDIPDGLPFIVDDGSLTGCDRLNTYLLTAWRQRAYDLESLQKLVCALRCADDDFANLLPYGGRDSLQLAAA